MSIKYLKTIMDIGLKSLIKNLNSNQYMHMELERGVVIKKHTYNRKKGFLTLGISTLFTKSYIKVYGYETPKNNNTFLVIKKYSKKYNIETYNYLK